MTHDEWKEIVQDQLVRIWPNYTFGDEKLSLVYDKQLRWFSAQMVACAITEYAAEHLDDRWPKGLWTAVRKYCWVRQHTNQTEDEYGFTAAERKNIVRHIREKKPADWEGHTDDAIYQGWLRQAGYLNRYTGPVPEEFRARIDKVCLKPVPSSRALANEQKALFYGRTA